MKLLVIGGGNMGLTYAKGIHNAQLLGEEIMVLQKSEESIARLKKEEPQFKIFSSAEDCVPDADIIMIAVKPFHSEDLFKQIKPFVKKDQLIISVMAGVKISTIQDGLGLDKIIRSMPNLPAMINQGMTTFTGSDKVSNEELKIVEKLLSSTGKAIKVKTEDDIDKTTGLSGSGSAYIFYFMEAMMESAKEMGFTEEEAKAITTQTFGGAVDLFRQKEETTSAWINKVCSKGGTTRAAINTFEEENVKAKIKKGIFAAYNRAVELGNS